MKFFTQIFHTINRGKDALFYRVSNFLDIDNDHFSCFYEGSTSPVGSWLLDRIFSKIKFNHKRHTKLYKLNEQGMVVYSVKYKNLFEFLYLNWAMKKQGLPYPEIGMDMGFILLLPLKKVLRIAVGKTIHFLKHFGFKDPYHSGYIAEEISKGRSCFLYLVGSDAFYERIVESKPDPLHTLIELQKKSERPILFVAHSIVFSSQPIRNTPTLLDIFLGSNERPGKLRRIVALIQRPEKISVEFSDPVNLKTFLSDSAIMGLETQFQVPILRNHLVNLLNLQKRSVTGPVLKTRGELFADILTDKTLQEFMQSHSESKGESLVKTKKKATDYFKEIASNYNLTTIYTFERILTWTFNNIFEGLVVDQDGLDRIKEASQKAPLILVPCHKSHLDYLLLSYLMFKKSMPCPHVAAGKNLSFWPLGPILRAGGAFFLRRTFKGAVLYSKIFSAYIEKLLFEGFNLEFFIEGGRSRSGKLLSPKLGLLSILVKAQQNGACKDLLFVPIYVGYDRVLEEDSYLNEIEGGKKNPESLFQLIRARKFLKRKYGKVYINFDQPFSLQQYIDESNLAPETLAPGTFTPGGIGKSNRPVQESSMENLPTNRLDEESQRRICKSMGYKLINSINSISIVTPYGIMANCILNSPGNRFSLGDLKSRAEVYMNLLIFFNAELSDTLIMDPNLAFYQVIHNFVSRKFIELADESDPEIIDTTRFIVKDNKRPILDYYKNNAISFFIPAAYTAVSILKKDTFQFSSQDLASTYTFLQNFFIDEFSFDEEKSCQEHIEECLKAFVEQGIMVPTPGMPDTFNITSEGFRRLKLFSSLLDPFLESYKVVLLFFETYPTDKFDDKDRIKKIQALGAKMYKRQEIVLKESLSKINYINACNIFLSLGIRGSEDLAMIKSYKEIIDNLLLITAVNRP